MFFGFCPQVKEENEDIMGRRAIKETELREQVRAENVEDAFRDGNIVAFYFKEVFLCRLTFVWLSKLCES